MLTVRTLEEERVFNILIEQIFIELYMLDNCEYKMTKTDMVLYWPYTPIRWTEIETSK